MRQMYSQSSFARVNLVFHWPHSSSAITQTPFDRMTYQNAKLAG